MAALIFGEPEAEEIARRIAEARLFAPALLNFELANVCWKKCRRDPAVADRYLAAYRASRRVPIEPAEIDHSQALDLAFSVGLTAYDASYLWLSQQLNAELVTLDRSLAHAFAALGR